MSSLLTNSFSRFKSLPSTLSPSYPASLSYKYFLYFMLFLICLSISVVLGDSDDDDDNEEEERGRRRKGGLFLFYFFYLLISDLCRLSKPGELNADNAPFKLLRVDNYKRRAKRRF